MTPGAKVKAEFAGWSADKQHFFVTTNERDAQAFDLYRYAIKDYRRLIELHQESGSDRRGENLAHVGLARAYALSGRLREAASTLERSPLSSLERRALASDPDFAELAKHPRYGKSLE